MDLFVRGDSTISFSSNCSVSITASEEYSTEEFGGILCLRTYFSSPNIDARNISNVRVGRFHEEDNTIALSFSAAIYVDTEAAAYNRSDCHMSSRNESRRSIQSNRFDIPLGVDSGWDIKYRDLFFEYVNYCKTNYR